MSTIQTARYEQFTKRLLRLVGGGIMPRLQNDLSPVINIEDPADAALLFWKGHRLASGTAAGTAAAAEFATCSLFNPLGSGVLIVVLLTQVGPNSIRWQFSLTQTRTALVQTNLRFNDTRAALTAVPRGELGFDSLAAIPTPTIWDQTVAAATAASNFRMPFVLAPGSGLRVLDTVAANNAQVNFQWLERAAETPELETG